VFEPIRKPGHSSAIRLGAVCLLWCAALLMAMPMAPGAESVAKQILALTEARTKVVWARSTGQKDHWAIMCFDTDDDR
jgi:SRSO17 transposase